MRVCLLTALAHVGLVPTGLAVEWGACPDGQHGSDCAFLQLPLDPSNLNLGNVTGFVRRFYGRSGPGQRAIWMFSGGPGDSSDAFSGGAEYFVQMDPSVTVYLQDQRGVGLSSPVNCDSPPEYLFDPANETTVASYRACNLQIAETFNTSARYFSTYNAALDFKAAIDLVDPDKISIYALSYGTYALNTYLQLPGARADALVMDGPVTPDRWTLENNGAWASRVAQDILNTCAQTSAVCR